MGHLVANYHTHNHLCNHAVGSVSDYVKKAVMLNMKEIGISDHNPTPKNFMNEQEYLDTKCFRHMKLEEFYNVYFRALQCKIGQIGQAASSISNCLKDVFVLIRDKVDPEMRHEECMQVLAQVSNAAVMLFGAAADHYNKHYEVDGTKQDFLDWANAILVMLFECGKNLDHIVNEWELSEEAYKFGKNLAKATGPQNF